MRTNVPYPARICPLPEIAVAVIHTSGSHVCCFSAAQISAQLSTCSNTRLAVHKATTKEPKPRPSRPFVPHHTFTRASHIPPCNSSSICNTVCSVARGTFLATCCCAKGAFSVIARLPACAARSQSSIWCAWAYLWVH